LNEAAGAAHLRADSRSPHALDERHRAPASDGGREDAERALDAFFVSVFDALKRGRRVTIGGFGTFMVSKRAERNGRNPRTGKSIKIPATRVPRFKSSRSVKSAVR
jgi:DNA-binding protein HU-beta